MGENNDACYTFTRSVLSVRPLCKMEHHIFWGIIMQTGKFGANQEKIHSGRNNSKTISVFALISKYKQEGY